MFNDATEALALAWRTFVLNLAYALRVHKLLDGLTWCINTVVKRYAK